MLPLDAPGLARVRFAVSPLWEVGLSALVLGARGPAVIYEPWLERVRRELDPVVRERITALAPGPTYVADFLTPTPTPTPTGDPGAEDAVGQVSATPVDVLARDLRQLARRGPSRWLAGLLADPVGARRELAELVGEYWQVAVAPHWQRFNRLATADIDVQLRAGGRGGQARMFANLHPYIRWTGAALDVAGACETTFGPADTSDGVVLVPSAFAWPAVHVLSNSPYVPTLAYGVRGVARLWEPDAAPETGSLESLLGRNRAAVLARLTVPARTSELAQALGLAPSTVSEHLSALTRAGLAGSRRDGRSVLYAATALGEQLLGR